MHVSVGKELMCMRDKAIGSGKCIYLETIRWKHRPDYSSSFFFMLVDVNRSGGDLVLFQPKTELFLYLTQSALLYLSLLSLQFMYIQLQCTCTCQSLRES